MDSQVNQRTIAPYGTWSSPISARMVADDGLLLTTPRLVGGVAWWLEGRPAEDGRVALVRARPGDAPADVVPAGFNVRTSVHEYGGGAYCVHGDIAFASSFVDQRLYRLESGSEPRPITPEVEGRRHRYADGRVTADGSLWIGVRERHSESDRSADVVNELVVLPTDGSGEPRIVAGGRDFYSNPRLSPDGTRVCFLAWDLPWMPWDGCELFVADFGADGTLSNVERVAGALASESVWQPEWSPSGELVFASDRSGWWNLERWDGGDRSVLHAREAEFGYPAWVFGASSYGFLADGRIFCAFDSDGFTHFGVLDPVSGTLELLDLGLDSFHKSPYVAVEGFEALVVAAAPTVSTRLVRVDLGSGAVDLLRSSGETAVPAEYLSAPQAIEFPTEGGDSAFALYYPPRNRDYEAPEGERPPLLVMVHGGPTASASAALDPETQFWTSRGFAVVDVNYGGSTGFGRAYRERLNGQWGVVDVADCLNAARYLADQGEADPDRLLIRGGSAGGYTTICALTFTDAFAAGTTYFGIADLDQFTAGETHKFELRYEHTLVGPYPERADLYRERSPIHFVDRISTPMLVLQGTDDRIVLPAQAELIVAALRERGIPHAYILFEGEGHGFRKAETIVRWYEAELSFYAQVLGFEPGDPVPRLALTHHPAPSL